MNTFFVKRQNIMEEKTYILKFSSKNNILSISSEENPDNSFELSLEELKLPMCANADAILEEIGNQIKQRFKEDVTLIFRCDQATKKAINKMAASNSVIFE